MLSGFEGLGSLEAKDSQTTMHALAPPRNYTISAGGISKDNHIRFWVNNPKYESCVRDIAASGSIEAISNLAKDVSFIFVDTRQRRLIAGRDRLGIGDVYFHRQNATMSASSDIALVLAQARPTSLCRRALAHYLRSQFLPPPYTPFEGVGKLAAGEILIAKATKSDLIAHQYKTPFYRFGEVEKLSGSVSNLFEQVYTELSEEAQSDPWLFLSSGGLDSTTNLIAARKAGRVMSACTAAFESEAFDESAYARSVCEFANIAWRGWRTPHFGLDDLRSLVSHLSEPICDRAYIPTRWMLETQTPGLLITGEGGDEVWGGPRRWSNHITSLSGYLQRIAATPQALRLALLEDEALIESVDEEEVSEAQDIAQANKARTLFEEAKAYQAARWLPENVIRKDTSAANGSVAFPLADERCVQFMSSLSADAHERGCDDKAFLRAYLDRQVPPETLSRPKMKFKIPRDIWLSAELGDFVLDQLQDARSPFAGLLNTRVLADMYRSPPKDDRILWGLFTYLEWVNESLERSRGLN